MKTSWDYSELALHYVKRPRYSDAAIDKVCTLAGLRKDSSICDIGAGTGILTKMLVERGYKVTAIEPNDQMRSVGMEQTKGLPVEWHEGKAEETGMRASAFDLVTFGSSFNTADRALALKETKRILKAKGWFCCMWNHRNLDDPFQHAVEECIKKHIAEYSYGTRREDQTEVIKSSGLYSNLNFFESEHAVSISAEDYLEAWRSHATLQRQAKEKMAQVIREISELLSGKKTLEVPYTTRVWMAQSN